uniref:AlNc14C268G9918 protein n=1 Tax=Albugo laibachii Nc14 TaxID=890382 RepID=F0WU97_9STRA|nr:AlNc14C268G9918 [Albugo laibachii Nc14]|eukprot:CCA24975.1 AlNc14C268G9918 [Albugo laibachii Nc14]
MFAKVIGNVSVVGLRAAYGEYEQRMNTTDCHGITRGTMGHPCSHVFRIRGNQSLESTDFDAHWWLDSPVYIHATDETISIANVLRRIQENYEREISPYRRQIIHQYLLALPAVLDIRDPVHMQGRGRRVSTHNLRLLMTGNTLGNRQISNRRVTTLQSRRVQEL